MGNENQILDYVVAIAYFSGSILMGYLFKFTLLKKIKKIFYSTQWKGDDLIIEAFNKIVIWCFVILGLYLSAIHLPFTNNYSFEVNQIIKIFIITIVTVFTSILAISFIRTYSNKNKKFKETSSILIIITRIVVFLTGLLIILDIIGINITPILTAMGVGGLAAALALQDTLSNFFAGIQILISKNINAGDFICLESGEEGFITDITWRSTTVRALSNKLIIVPNSKLTASQIINFDLPDSENAVLVDIGVSYNSDLKKVENVVTEVATHIMKTIEGGNPEFTPFIRYHTFSDFSINFNVIMRVKKYTDHYLVKHEFIKAIHERFTAENIEIPFPVRTIKMS